MVEILPEGFICEMGSDIPKISKIRAAFGGRNTCPVYCEEGRDVNSKGNKNKMS